MNEIQELTQIVKQTAFNVASISEQMGLISKEVRDLKIGQRELSEGLKAVNDRMQNYEDRIRVTRPQAQNIRNSIHARTAILLHIEYENGIVKPESMFADKYYRQGFISRCYTDARKSSRLGTPYTETYQRDYDEVLHFISGWEPPTGVEGYKSYLDARRRK